MSTDNGDNEPRPKFMRFVRRFAVPILIAWLLLTVALNVLVPPIESVARNHAVTMSPQDAPAMIAAKRIGAQIPRVELRQHRDDHPGER